MTVTLIYTSIPNSITIITTDGAATSNKNPTGFTDASLGSNIEYNGSNNVTSNRINDPTSAQVATKSYIDNRVATYNAQINPPLTVNTFIEQLGTYTASASSVGANTFALISFHFQ